jgi:hypothetical protein
LSFQCNLEEYKNHLEKFLFYMQNNQEVDAKWHQVANQASSIYSKLKSIRDSNNWSLSISPPLNVPIENDRDFQKQTGFLLISGGIEVKHSMLAFHSFSVCVVANGQIVRRFHFDIDAAANIDGRPKCHLQYGGDAQRELQFMSHLKHNLDSWLKKPRLPFPPFDIVLLFDLILRQLGTAVGTKFVEETYWKRLVKESERITMRSYYDYIHAYFGGSTPDTLFDRLSS